MLLPPLDVSTIAEADSVSTPPPLEMAIAPSAVETPAPAKSVTGTPGPNRLVKGAPPAPVQLLETVEPLTVAVVTLIVILSSLEMRSQLADRPDGSETLGNFVQSKSCFTLRKRYRNFVTSKIPAL